VLVVPPIANPACRSDTHVLGRSDRDTARPIPAQEAVACPTTGTTIRADCAWCHAPLRMIRTTQLYGPGDLQVTTDFRDVLGEIVAKRLGNAALGAVFPGYSSFNFGGIVRD
jgi:hypothetical protein